MFSAIKKPISFTILSISLNNVLLSLLFAFSTLSIKCSYLTMEDDSAQPHTHFPCPVLPTLLYHDFG